MMTLVQWGQRPATASATPAAAAAWPAA